jgi:hypothetical protein
VSFQSCHDGEEEVDEMERGRRGEEYQQKRRRRARGEGSPAEGKTVAKQAWERRRRRRRRRSPGR